jgi:hypothetical protein
MPSASRSWRLGVALWTCCSAAPASDLYVVCNTNVSLRPGEVREVFIGEKSFAGAIRLAPADNLAAQATFLGKVVKFTADKYTSLWTKKAFRDGINPPLVMVNDNEALAYVRQTPGACSYVEAVPPPGVAVVGKF